MNNITVKEVTIKHLTDGGMRIVRMTRYKSTTTNREFYYLYRSNFDPSGKVTTKEECLKEWIELRTFYGESLYKRKMQTIKEYTINNEEYTKKLIENFELYPEYIEDGKQWKNALEMNRYIEEIARHIKYISDNTLKEVPNIYIDSNHSLKFY